MKNHELTMIKSGFITGIQIILSILNFSVLGFDHTTRGFAQVLVGPGGRYRYPAAAGTDDTQAGRPPRGGRRLGPTTDAGTRKSIAAWLRHPGASIHTSTESGHFSAEFHF
eukprot:COSAG02_NODE_11693_length_1672_cov_4.446281_1_plen_111_part_00